MGKIEYKCKKAADMYLIECKSGFPKYKYLPEWLESKAYYLKRGRLTNNKKYQKLSRGALVKVDFGVNVGSELSGPHFAVVVSKNDNISNGVITVVPVTSHPNRFTVQLDSFISEKSLVKIYEYMVNELMDILAKILKHENIEPENYVSYLIKEDPRYAGFFNDKSMTVKTLSKKVSALGNSYAPSPLKVTDTIKQIDLVRQSYGKYNKVSYAKCKDITTISKDRIIKINKFDPSGSIKVLDATLNAIDAEIQKNYTGITG